MADCIVPQYFPAAYNGVFFQALVAGSDHGRRGVTGEFPFGENTAYQDMGIKIRKYAVSGRFQGPQCITQTNALIAAVETPGPGQLIHPTRGQLTVACSSLKIKDELIAGAGETNFEMEFIDASTGAAMAGGGLPSIAGIDDMLTAITSSFDDNYTPANVIFFQQPEVSTSVQSALQALATGFAQAIPGSNNDAVWQALYNVQSTASNTATWQSADDVITTLQYGSAAIDTYATTPQVEYNMFETWANQFAQSATVDGTGGQCQEAIFSAVRILCAAYMSRAAAETVSETLGDALDMLDAISTILEQEIINAVATNNIDLHIALVTFKASALQALLNYAYTLPPVLQYNFNGGVPSLVAAHEIYGDCTQFMALEQRNPNNYPFALGPVLQALGTAA